MNFDKFSILNPRALASNKALEEVEMLINLDHIVSIKPIRIALPTQILNGFWIRMTNGKKYKATKIPERLVSILGENYSTLTAVNFDQDEQLIEQ